MNENLTNTLNHFLDCVRSETEIITRDLDLEALERAKELIQKAEASGNRVHVSGVGKPGHLAGYIASLLSSTGTPSYFLHGTEAVHGSSGQIVPGDVVIFISNSGKTAEMMASVSAVVDNGAKVIGVSGNPDSWLAKHSDIHLLAHVDDEGGPLNRAPRTSILAESIVLQALSVLLQADKDIDAHQYVKWHPGGSLGVLRENEK